MAWPSTERWPLHPIALLPLLALVVAAGAGAVLIASNRPPDPPARLPRDATSAQAFAALAEVLHHPRCMNCHSSDERPRQGEAGASRHHAMNVVRGIDDRGGLVQRCVSCHGRSNHAASRVPGAPHWQLAPRSMGWTGLTTSEICQAVTDRRRNGNRMPDAIVKHLETDPLVRWAWAPGGTRAPPPIPYGEFLELVRYWSATGARCP